MRCGCHADDGWSRHGGHVDARRTVTAAARATDGTTVGWHNPNRPGRHYGTSTGVVPGGTLTRANFDPSRRTRGPVRAATCSCRSCSCAPTPATSARDRSSAHSGRAPTSCSWPVSTHPSRRPCRRNSGRPRWSGGRTPLYAHVWNFGLSQAPNVVVEFYWCDPTLGIGPSGAHLIGATDGLARSSRQRPVACRRQVPDAVVPDLRQRRPRVSARPRVGRDERWARHASMGRIPQPARWATQHPRRRGRRPGPCTPWRAVGERAVALLAPARR